MRHLWMRLFSVLTAAMLGTMVAGCGQDDTREITTTRIVESPQADPETPPRERFGMRDDAGGGPMAAQAGAPESLFDYQIPPGWQPAPTSSMRLVNFVVPNETGGEPAEAYVTVLGGDGGGVEANVNRWRQQMGQDPLSPDEIAQLPTIELLGRDALYLHVDGAYTGMRGETNIEDASMLGAIFIAGGRAVFVKMTGPSDLVHQEEEHFKRFVNSLTPAGAQPPEQPATQSADAGDLPEGHPPIEGAGTGSSDSAGLPPGHPPVDGGMDQSGSGFDPAALSWKAPEGWDRGRESQMRLATYLAGENDGVETAVYVFPGDTGGVEANVNRWLEQIGQEPIPPDAIEALPTVTVLGVDAPLVEGQGTYTGMGGQENEGYGLLGAIVPLESHSLFIKMTGPAEEVSEQKKNFIAFAESFEQ